MKNPLHSKESVRWGTPRWLVDVGRKQGALDGEFDLDPCSEAKFNETVKAKTFFTAEQDGLQQNWIEYRSIIVNPPGGLVDEFWYKATQTFCHAVMPVYIFWIGFSLNQLATLQKKGFRNLSPLDVPGVILRKRVQFEHPEGKKSSPTHYNYILFLGNDDRAITCNPDLGVPFARY